MFDMKKVVFVLLALISSSCSTKSRPQIEEPFRHSVKFQGESIGLIAEWYTGDKSNSTAITKENNNIDPARIEIGDSLIIPRGLLLNSKPLTEEYVRAKNTPTASPDIKVPVSESNAKVSDTQEQSPLSKRSKKETEELIKTREDLWQELIGE
jgi:hypothetical protein